MTEPLAEHNLKQVATILGVHYMTAYRYVRSLQLPARRVGANWMVGADDLALFQDRRLRLIPAAPASEDSLTWRSRIRPALEAGDEVEGWRIIDHALASGYPPVECYLDILVGAVSDISEATHGTPRANEYLAVSTASRLVARLGARLRRPGRSRGTIIFGAPAGEHHSFPIAVVADLVRLSGFTCLELGPNVPPAVFANAIVGVRRVVAVGIGVTMTTSFSTLQSTLGAIRAADESMPIVLGGQAFTDVADPTLMDNTRWARDGRDAVAIFSQLADERRPHWAITGQ